MNKSKYISVKSSQSAFTIVELIVVIVVIGVLAVITIVSYTGITAKANIATMQSDLANAAKKLNLYQVADPSNDYPADQAAAIAANVIKPSPNMDYTYYGVDNTSNPKYYCYMYRKGTDIWAVDGNSRPTKGACLQNMITNGDFRDGTNGWGAGDGSISVVDGILNYNVVTLGTTASYIVQNLRANMTVGNKYYVKADIKPKYSNSTRFYVGSYISGQLPIPNTWNTYSEIVDNISVSSSQPRIVHYTSTNYVIGDVVYFNNAMLIDLTAVFGVGNEPTKTQVDAMVAQSPNDWFDITAKGGL